jgi:AcrR family transcriptional regulator
MPAKRGRPRDSNLDEAIVHTAQRLLAEGRYFHMTIDDIAGEIGTTKPAIYRRFHGKEELALAAVGALRSARWPPQTTDDLRADLIWQLNDLRVMSSRFSGMLLTGLLMADEDRRPEWMETFRSRVVRTRRDAIRKRLELAIEAGQVRRDADVWATISLLLGYWYATYLEGGPLDDHWAERGVDILMTYLRSG